MPQADINYLAIIVATVMAQVIGFVWYSMPLFGKPWMHAVGKTEADLKKGAATSGYIVAIVSALVTAYVLAHFVDYTGATSAATGAVTGFWLWLGFILGPMAMNQVFEGRSKELLWINAGMQLVTMLLMGALLAVWR